MRPKRRARALLTTALACLILAALNSNVSTQTRPDSPDDSISATVRALRQVNGDEAYDSKIPTDARALLTKLKHQLRDLVQKTLDADAAASTPASVLQARVLAALRREGVTTGGPPDDVHTFGSVMAIDVTLPRGHRDLIAVTTTVSVHCGSDSSLYLFRREGARWRLALADEANGYEQVNGARAHFYFRVSPTDAGGDLFVAVADVNPWCTSSWQVMRYRVLRVGEDAYSPRVVLKGDDSIYLGTDLEGFRLTADANTFTLRFDSSQSLDPGRLIRPHVLKFKVEGEHAERVAPVALAPEDFADEWAQMKWDEAARWSEPSRLSELKKWHETVNPDGKGFSGSEILFVRPCGRAASEWQIGVEVFHDSVEEKDAARLPAKLFFTVAREGEVFRMLAVGDAQPRGCAGAKPASAGGAR
ncbi:MAG TPA: hypothetical protein VGP08_07290 [Pyrinomonadaceae bacterium]|jgi:hypothetical protein|nr:hypothetical protein [Pyrinomonadaceae bacterium]